MTSNQVAAEANVIQREMNEWTKQHNEEYREETKRHNQEMEKLQEQSILAQEHGNTIQENWNKWQQQWQRDYQYELQKLERAQAGQKLAIEEELATLEARRVNAEESYKAAQEANFVFMQGISADQLALDKSFKEWEKGFKEKNYELSAFQAGVEAKRVEYDYSLRHEQNINTRNWQVAQNTYNYALLNWEREKTNKQLANALQLGNYNYQVGLQNVEIARQNLDLYEKKVKAENFQSYSTGLFGRSGYIPGIVGTVETGIKLFGGFANGKTAVKVAEALLFK